MAGRESLEMALNAASTAMDQVKHIGCTGFGAKAISMAAHYFFPNAGTVADVGAEGDRAAKCDQNSGVVDFAINEKCAAGTVRGMGVFSDLLSVPIGNGSFGIRPVPEGQR